MKNSLDKQISLRVRSLMESNNIKGVTIANWLGIRPSSASDMILGKSPWRIQYLTEIAIYFSITLEELIFDDAEFIKKRIEEMKNLQKEHLLKYADTQPNSEMLKNTFRKVLKWEE